MTFSRKILLATSLLLGLIGLSSCKEKAPQVDDISLFDLRLASFGLNSAKNTSLQTVAFSIKNHTSGASEVFNKTPIAYGQEIGEVKLLISATDPATKVEIALGEDAAFKVYDPKGTYNLSNIHRFKLRLSQAQKEETRTHIYNVEIRQFRYNPMTIDWVAKSVGQLPILGELGNKAFVSAGLMHLFTRSAQGLRHYTATSVEDNWQEQMNVLPVGSTEHLVEVEQGLGSFYGLGSNGGIYQLQGNNWIKLAQEPTAKALLAVLPARSTRESDRLALLLEGSESELRGKTDANSRYVYGYYQAGKVVRSGYVAPSDFPLAHRSVVREYSATTGSRIYLVGVAGVRTAWYTTNAEDWQKLSSSSSEGLRYGALAVSAGQLYSLESSAEGLKAWVSQDLGMNWNDAQEYGLRGLDAKSFANVPVVVFVDEKTDKLYLLQGNTMAGGQTKLYIGEPLKDAI